MHNRIGRLRPHRTVGSQPRRSARGSFIAVLLTVMTAILAFAANASASTPPEPQPGDQPITGITLKDGGSYWHCKPKFRQGVHQQVGIQVGHAPGWLDATVYSCGTLPPDYSFAAGKFCTYYYKVSNWDGTLVQQGSFPGYPSACVVPTVGHIKHYRCRDKVWVTTNHTKVGLRFYRDGTKVKPFQYIRSGHTGSIVAFVRSQYKRALLPNHKRVMRVLRDHKAQVAGC